MTAYEAFEHYSQLESRCEEKIEVALERLTAMTMTERWPYRGDEIQVFDLTPEEAYRQSLLDYKTSRKGIIKCAIKRWLKLKL